MVKYHEPNPITATTMTLGTSFAVVYFNNSSPTVGPMGGLTKNPIYQQQLMQQSQIN